MVLVVVKKVRPGEGRFRKRWGGVRIDYPTSAVQLSGSLVNTAVRAARFERELFDQIACGKCKVRPEQSKDPEKSDQQQNRVSEMGTPGRSLSVAELTCQPAIPGKNQPPCQSIENGVIMVTIRTNGGLVIGTTE